MAESRENIAESILRFAETRYTGGLDPEGSPFMLLGNDLKVADLREYQKQPDRVRRNLELLDEESFIEYVTEWEQRESAIFADRGALRITAVLDEHSAVGNPSWCTHRAIYGLTPSREWKAWLQGNEVLKSQTEFLEFLEDRIDDFVAPTGPEMMAVISQFRVTRNSVFSSDVDLSTGEVSFHYADTNNRSGSVEVPPMFSLRLRVFERGDPYEVKARLRYRVAEGKLVLAFQLIEPERYVDDAFDGVVQHVRDGVQVSAVFRAKAPGSWVRHG